MRRKNGYGIILQQCLSSLLLCIIYFVCHQQGVVSCCLWTFGISASKTSVHFLWSLKKKKKRDRTCYYDNKTITCQKSSYLPVGYSAQQSSSQFRHRRWRRWILPWVRASAPWNQHIRRTQKAPAQPELSASSWGVGKVGWASPEACRLFPGSEWAEDEGGTLHENSSTMQVYARFIAHTSTGQTYS